MPLFATACAMHKVYQQICLQTLGHLKVQWDSFLTHTMPCRRPDRVALVAHRVASATRQSCRVAARLCGWNGECVRRGLSPDGPPRRTHPLLVGAPYRPTSYPFAGVPAPLNLSAPPPP